MKIIPVDNDKRMAVADEGRTFTANDVPIGAVAFLRPGETEELFALRVQEVDAPPEDAATDGKPKRRRKPKEPTEGQPSDETPAETETEETPPETETNDEPPTTTEDAPTPPSDQE